MARRHPPAGLRAAGGLGLALALVSLVPTALFVDPVGVFPMLLGLALLVAASTARAAR